MKKLLLAAAAATALLAGATSAQANGSIKDVPVAGSCANFGGFYVGIHAGGVMYRADRNDDDGFLTDNAGHARTEDGAFGGGQVGYNWQRGCAIFGLEADGSWTDIDANFQDNPNAPDNNGINATMDWFLTMRARTGVVVENLMLYVTGGLAAAKIKNVYFDSPPPSFSFSDTRWGWTAGIGAERSLGGGWSLKSEALYLQFEQDEETFTSGADFQFTTNDSAWIGRLALNYTFGGHQAPQETYKPAVAMATGPCAMFSGFYVGVHAGGVMYRADRNDDDGYLTDNAGHARTDEGGLGGGQIGYNIQRGCTIFGFEADGAWTDVTAAFEDEPNQPAVQGIDAEMDSVYTLRTRSGVVVNNLFLYVTGGLAAAKINNRYFEDGPVESFSFSDTRWGWTAGFGAEWALGGRWSLKSEALYMQFEEDEETFVNTNGTTFQFTTNDSAWIGRVGLNHRFGAPARQETYKGMASASSGPCAMFRGFYVGGHGGIARYRADRNDDDGFLTDNAGHARTDETGFGGGQAGYNWQRGCTLFGVEADGSWSDASAVFEDNPNAPDNNGINADMDWFLTLRTRSGIVVDNLLLYVTGGLAAADINSTYFDSPPPSFSFSDTRWGWTAGFGTEWAFSDRWSLKSETLYLKFEEEKDVFTAAGPTTFQFTANDSAWVSRLGVNYRFGAREIEQAYK